MKKALVALLPISLLLPLTACGGETETITIEIEHTSSYSDRIDGYIEAFEEANPGIKVTNTKTSGGYNDLANNIIQGFGANDYPDIFLGYPDAAAAMMAYPGKVVNMETYMNDPDIGWTSADYEDIIPAYLKEGQEYPMEGTYSLPFAKSTEAMYYNADVLIGLDLSKINADINNGNPLTAEYINSLTWEEFFDKLAPAIVAYNDSITDASQKIIKDSEQYNEMVLGYDSDDNLFITLAEQYGYAYTDVDQATGQGKILFNDNDIDSNGDGTADTNGMKQLMKKWNGYKNKGYVRTQGSNDGNYTNYSFTAQASLFSIGSTGGIKYQQSDDFTVGVAPIPYAASGKRAVINQGPSLIFLSHGDTARERASWLFYKFMTNETNAADWTMNTGYSPIRYSITESAEWGDYTNENAGASTSLESLTARVAKYVSNATQVTDHLYSSPVFIGSSEARDQVSSIVTTLLMLSEADCTDAAINSAFQTAYDNTLKEVK